MDIKKELVLEIEDLTEKQVAYILHRYYPENRDRLTPLDWKLYLTLTNYVCGSRYLPHRGSAQHVRLEQIMKDLV